MMTFDQILYFINHIADADHADKTLRLWQAFWMMGLPVMIALFHLTILSKLFRGKIRNLVWIAISMFLWSIIVPLILILYSAIYIGDYGDMAYIVLSYVFFAILYIIGIQEYFPRYCYATDAEYKAATVFSDGSLINTMYLHKAKLYASAIWIMIMMIMLLASLVAFLIALVNKQPFTIAMVTVCIGSPMLFIHLVLLRWFVKCPNCHRPIYNVKYNEGAKNENIYFVKTAIDVLFKKKFECITCHAHYYVKNNGNDR